MEMYVLSGSLFTSEWRGALSDLRIRAREIDLAWQVNADLGGCRRPLILDVTHPGLERAKGWEREVIQIGAPLLVLFAADRLGVSILSRVAAAALPCVLVCRGINDSPDELRDHIRNARRDEIAIACVERLVKGRNALLPTVVVALHRLFLEPATFKSVTCLAHAGGMTRRSFDRHTAAVGLEAGTLIRCARLARALMSIRNGSNLKTAMAHAGYQGTSRFRMHLASFFPGVPLAAIKSLPLERVVHGLLDSSIGRRVSYESAQSGS